MACGGNSGSRRASGAVWSKASTSVAMFKGFAVVDSTNTDTVRLDLVVYAKSTYPSLKRGWRGSNNGGVSWSSVTEFGSAVTATGLSMGAGFTSVDQTYRLIEYGVTTVNSSGSATDSAQIAVITNTRST